tara:strand:+ start:204 stop:932 length:729 start_codon:yes stop_codon:yes gene_type:complete
MIQRILIIALLIHTACGTGSHSSKSSEIEKEKPTKIKYLALGDSYTIGESVAREYSFPYQLSHVLQSANYALEQPTIIAKTGWRTDQLIAATKEKELPKEFQLVSILIGVNNQYQSKPIKIYKQELTQIIELAESLCIHGKKGLFMMSIPDYGVTPFAKNKNPRKISIEIKQYNELAREIAKEHGIPFYDITPISQKARTDLSLIAEDNLHPSAKMYKLWVSEIREKVIQDILLPNGYKHSK